MKSKLFIAFIAIAAFTISCGNKKGGTDGPITGTEEIELKLNLPKGKVYDMQMSMNSQAEMDMMGQAVATNTDMTMGMDYEIKDVLENGNFLIRTTYKKIKMSGSTKMGGQDSGMSYEYDSEADKVSGMQAEQMAKSMKAMIGQYTEMEMDKFGKVVKTTMSEGLKNGKESDGMNNMNYAVFPDKKIKVGDTWDSEIEQDMNGIIAVIKTKYKLESLKDGIAEISMDGTMNLKEGAQGKLTGTQKGTSKIEVSTGLSKEVNIDQDLDMEMNEMGMKMPMKLKNKVTITMK